MRCNGVPEPRIEARIASARLHEFRWLIGQLLVFRIAEAGSDIGDERRIDRQRAILDVLPFGIDFGAEFFRAHFVDENLDAGFVDVVAPAVLVVDAQDRLDVAQQIAFRQERLDRFADERRATQPAADDDLEAALTGTVLVEAQPDIVDAHRGPVVRRGRDRDLELARQIGELRVHGGMLPENLRPDTRIFDFVRRDAAPLVGGDVAHAIAAGLHAVQTGLRKVSHHVRKIAELDPVELKILPRGEVPIVAVVAPRDVSEHAELFR